jgi:hypothetical protein
MLCRQAIRAMKRNSRSTPLKAASDPHLHGLLLRCGPTILRGGRRRCGAQDLPRVYSRAAGARAAPCLAPLPLPARHAAARAATWCRAARGAAAVGVEPLRCRRASGPDLARNAAGAQHLERQHMTLLDLSGGAASFQGAAQQGCQCKGHSCLAGGPTCRALRKLLGRYSMVRC